MLRKKFKENVLSDYSVLQKFRESNHWYEIEAEYKVFLSVYMSEWKLQKDAEELDKEIDVYEDLKEIFLANGVQDSDLMIATILEAQGIGSIKSRKKKGKEAVDPLPYIRKEISDKEGEIDKGRALEDDHIYEYLEELKNIEYKVFRFLYMYKQKLSSKNLGDSTQEVELYSELKGIFQGGEKIFDAVIGIAMLLYSQCMKHIKNNEKKENINEILYSVLQDDFCHFRTNDPQMEFKFSLGLTQKTSIEEKIKKLLSKTWGHYYKENSVPKVYVPVFDEKAIPILLNDNDKQCVYVFFWKKTEYSNPTDT